MTWHNGPPRGKRVRDAATFTARDDPSADCVLLSAVIVAYNLDICFFVKIVILVNPSTGTSPYTTDSPAPDLSLVVFLRMVIQADPGHRLAHDSRTIFSSALAQNLDWTPWPRGIPLLHWLPGRRTV
jgi:hypothetical protein